jgi:hypothetical protein
VCNNDILLMYILLEEFKDFKDVFNIIKISILLDHNKFKYVIKTISDPSFRSLHNLLRNELEVLKDYLKNALTKC